MIFHWLDQNITAWELYAYQIIGTAIFFNGMNLHRSFYAPTLFYFNPKYDAIATDVKIGTICRLFCFCQYFITHFFELFL